MMHFQFFAQVVRRAITFPAADEMAHAAAARRQDSLTKPLQGSSGRLEEIALFMAAWRGLERPWTALAHATELAAGALSFQIAPLSLTRFQVSSAGQWSICEVKWQP